MQLQFKLERSEVRGGDKFVSIPIRLREDCDPILDIFSSESIIRVKIGFTETYTRAQF